MSLITICATFALAFPNESAPVMVHDYSHLDGSTHTESYLSGGDPQVKRELSECSADLDNAFPIWPMPGVYLGKACGMQIVRI